jgi:signal transduction histidine kinase
MTPMNMGRPLAGQLRRHPALVPALLALAFILVPLIVPAGVTARGGRGLDISLTGPDVALTLAGALALTGRRHVPLLTLLVTGSLAAVSIVGQWQVNLAQLAVAVALFNYGLVRPRRQTLLAAAVAGVSLGALSVAMVFLDAAAWGRQNIVLWLATAAAAAIAVASNRATVVALEDRVRRAEESQEATARRRVAEDRVRIARELHDVIAHHVAVISVQAGVVEHVVERDPAAAREALVNVRASSKAVLAELQSVLGVLRQEESALPTAPAPGLSDLDELVASFRSMGTPITVHTPDPVPRLSPTADLAAYRLVQEALTNVHKHAPGAATTVLVGLQDDSIEVVVSNERPPADHGTAEQGTSDVAAPSGSGLGLVGMVERVAAIGGTVSTRPTRDGGFRVAARIPLSEQSR